MKFVLSLFPGIGLLDKAFEDEGFCVVRGPDVLWGGDIRSFHPPAGKFDGIIGGPPCQAFSRLAFIVRSNGYEPRFGNLIPEFERCVREARPRWFVMENVPDAPVPSNVSPSPGSLYGIHTFVLNNRQLGETVSRSRRWTWGSLSPIQRALHIETQVFEPIEYEYAVIGRSYRTGIGNGNDPRRKGQSLRRMDRKSFPLSSLNYKSQAKFADFCRKQGLPDGFDLPPFKMEAKFQAVGNGVPLAMGRAIAKAVNRALGSKEAVA